MKSVRPLSHRAAWLLLALVLFGPSAARAQLSVMLQLNKNQYVAYEPIQATVTIANRAGKDIVLGEVDGRSWLSFNVAAIGGEPILAYAGEPRPEPRVIAAGQMWKETISLGKFYPLGGNGNYSVRASVYFHDLRQYYGSNTKAFSVTDGVKAWEDQIGVPRSPGSTQIDYRKFTLLTYQEEDKISLFVRIRDERTQRVIATYSLGRLVPFRDVQPTLDAEGKMHVLFLTGPKAFRHVVVTHNGEKLTDEVFEEKPGSSPQLRISNIGRVRVEGGSLYDPTKPPETPREVVHRLTERPAGAPEGDVE